MTIEGVPADASAFTYLAKADALADAQFALGPLLATPAVWREVVTDGRQRGYADAERVVDAHARGQVVGVELDSEQANRAALLRERSPLGTGESETIVIAVDGGRALIDDRVAARVARELGVRSISTLSVPLLMSRRGRPKAETLPLLERLGIVMGVRLEAVTKIEQEIRRKT